MTQPGCSPLAGQICARKAERQHHGTSARQEWASKTQDEMEITRDAKGEIWVIWTPSYLKKTEHRLRWRVELFRVGQSELGGSWWCFQVMVHADEVRNFATSRKWQSDPGIPAPGSAALKGMRRLAHRVERSCAHNLQEPQGGTWKIPVFCQWKGRVAWLIHLILVKIGIVHPFLSSRRTVKKFSKSQENFWYIFTKV